VSILTQKQHFKLHYDDYTVYSDVK